MNKRYDNNMLGFCAEFALRLKAAGLDDALAADAAAIVTDATNPAALYESNAYVDRVLADTVTVLKAGKVMEADRAAVLSTLAKGAARFVQYLP